MNLSPTREVTLDRETHRYYVDGVLFEGPSVTEILSYLGKDYDGIDPYYADRGTAVHLAVELHIKGVLDPESVDPEVAPYLAAYQTFEKETGFKPLHAELPLISDLHGFATTLDLVGLLAERLVVIDLKTSASVDPIVELQLGGQSLAWDEHHRTETIQGRYYLQLKKDGYKLKDVTHINPKLFLRAFHLFRDWKSKHVRKKK